MIGSFILDEPFEAWQPTGAGFALCYPSRRRTPAALKTLIDFLRKNRRVSR